MQNQIDTRTLAHSIKHRRLKEVQGSLPPGVVLRTVAVDGMTVYHTETGTHPLRINVEIIDGRIVEAYVG
jgi:hypothetical protein